MRLFIAFFFFIGFSSIYGQSDSLFVPIKGSVYNSETRLPMNNVHVINTSRMNGAITDNIGLFELMGKVSDTLLISYLGYETIKVKVSNDWVKNQTTKIYLTEKAYALEEVTLSTYNLTGYIEVDTKLIPIVEEKYRYNIAGLNKGYEGGRSSGSVGNILGSLFDPADFLYNVFGKRPAQMRKLKQMKKDDTVRSLLSSKFDRETLAALLEMDKNDIPQLLQNCNYSEYFIKNANDLQILDAISQCYEEYKVLNKKK